MKILLCVSGSVAAIKTWDLIKGLEKIGQVRTVFSEKGEFFANQNKPDGRFSIIFKDKDEWKWNNIGDRILHIDLKDWADVLVIAPLSANTLAKIYNGFCDNLLTSIYRAWPMNKPIVLAPAMNTDMWDHPLTKDQLDLLSRRHLKSINGNFTCVEPIEKMLACGVQGMGAMAEIESIVEAVKVYNE